MDGKGFHLVYQSLVDVETGSVVGFEALMRWTHPELGPVGPGEFIPVAEQTGMIGALGDWAMRTACRQLVVLRAGMPDDARPFMADPYPHFSLAAKILIQLADPAFAGS